jgi:hypothetical protein
MGIMGIMGAGDKNSARNGVPTAVQETLLGLMNSSWALPAALRVSVLHPNPPPPPQ